MKKPELLAPAGNMETLILAINSGADAVYVGGESFSARAFAKNFDKKELLKAVKFCHLHGKKIFEDKIVLGNMSQETINKYLDYYFIIGIGNNKIRKSCKTLFSLHK